MIERTFKILKKETNDHTIKISQFNMLADQLSDGGFKNINKSWIEWKHRKPLIIKELENVNADIMCIEENDKFEDLKNHFQNFQGIHFPKKGDSKKERDGSTIFFRKELFELIEKKKVRKSNTIIAKLKYKANNKEIIVAALHLKAKSGNEKIRESQIKILLDELKHYNKHNSPLIICGDFNDEPKSLCYNRASSFVSNGSPLKSSYSLFDESGVEPISTYKEREYVSKRCIDYIFYSNQLTPVQLLEIPDFEKPLPTEHYPSDHICIYAVFEWK
eukprot:TRINITY_DN6744_c0_g1_i1.p1 TRINITY_DN6744_c0_g1~~TRINITY_DN6744_c0_g1_i1.p1  ORF type:complete len:275 (+),score=76.03 TRINITY_DN6744_c0_g1_i1:80-904(+)